MVVICSVFVFVSRLSTILVIVDSGVDGSFRYGVDEVYLVVAILVWWLNMLMLSSEFVFSRLELWMET